MTTPGKVSRFSEDFHTKIHITNSLSTVEYLRNPKLDMSLADFFSAKWMFGRCLGFSPEVRTTLKLESAVIMCVYLDDHVQYTFSHDHSCISRKHDVCKFLIANNGWMPGK